MKIKKSKDSYIEDFYTLWQEAIVYHKQNNYPIFPIFPREQILLEIDEGLHYSVYSKNDECIGFFSLALEDFVIWEEQERNDAIYIHRMCSNRKFKEVNLSKMVLVWGYEYVIQNQRRYVRMDTWGDNKKLVAHYISSGFKVKQYKQLGKTPELASHYDNILLIMFENDVEEYKGLNHEFIKKSMGK